jgi:hypothetical protein
MIMKDDECGLARANVKRAQKMWVLGVDAHEQVLSLAEIQTSIEHQTVSVGGGGGGSHGGGESKESAVV